MNALTCTLPNCTDVEVPLSKAGIQQLLLLGGKQHDNMVVVVRKKNSRCKLELPHNYAVGSCIGLKINCELRRLTEIQMELQTTDQIQMNAVQSNTCSSKWQQLC